MNSGGFSLYMVEMLLSTSSVTSCKRDLSFHSSLKISRKLFEKGASFFIIILYALLPRSQPNSTVVKSLIGA